MGTPGPTYVGAMPGRLVRNCSGKGKESAHALDKVDLVRESSSALLEVLDGEQNKHFVDHYVEIRWICPRYSLSLLQMTCLPVLFWTGWKS